MSLGAIVLLAGFVVGVLLLAVPMGRWLAAIAQGSSPGFARLDHGVLRACGADPQREHGWREYALAVLVFNVLGAITVYALQRLQGALPLNPQGFAGVEAGSAVNSDGATARPMSPPRWCASRPAKSTWRGAR